MTAARLTLINHSLCAGANYHHVRLIITFDRSIDRQSSETIFGRDVSSRAKLAQNSKKIFDVAKKIFDKKCQKS